MKRFILIAVVVVLALSFVPQLSAAKVDEYKARAMADVLLRYYGQSAAESKMYVGSEMCLACHESKVGWRDSLHGTAFNVTDTSAFSMQLKHGVVADYNRNGIDDFVEGLDFNQISSPFDKYKPNAPILKYDDQNGYQIQIGELTMPVKFAYGGSGYWKQRYVVKIPVKDRPGGLSAGHYISPVQYNEVTDQYTTYHPETWWDENGQPLYDSNTTAAEVAAKGKSFDAGCAGCHFTGLAVWKDGNGEWRAQAPVATLYYPNDPHYYDFDGNGIKEQINTGCERCHGPGSLHILGRGDPEEIINPKEDWTEEQANMLCGSCHTRGKSVPGRNFGYPYDEAANQAYASALGEDLDRFFDPAPGRWPDGVSPTKHRQQYLEFLESSKPTFQFHKVTCYECHDVHNTEEHHAVTEVESDGVVIPTQVDNNTLCLACHSTHGDFETLTKEDIANYEQNRDKIAKVVRAHTNHPYEPERQLGLSRCIECHMPKVAKSAVPYDIRSHTFEPIPPEKTLVYQDQGGMPNACAVRCHRGLNPAFGLPEDKELTNWTEPGDVSLAQWLLEYYGPNGKWWQHSVGEGQ